MIKRFRNRSVRAVGLGVATVLALLLFSTFSDARPRIIPVRVDRWLEIRQTTGEVTYHQGGTAQRAAIGQKLQAVGDGINTGKRSTANLSVDTGIGTIRVGEQTQLRIQALQRSPDQGRITRLQVTGGQVQLKVRRFTHPGSRLQIETPSGVSGVRGTEFGVSVQPNGKTGLATLEGSVVASAQGQLVPVEAGFQNLTMPGEPPTPAVPLRNDPGLQIRVVKDIQQGFRMARLIGQTDPVNTVIIQEVPQNTDREGRFDISLPVPSYPQYRIVVTTPLGKKQVYELAI